MAKSMTSALLGAAAMVLSATGAIAAPPTATYIAKAGAGDLYERRSSEIVLQSTHDPAIRRFASMMVSDHSSSTQMVKTAAMRAGLHPAAPMLDRDQQRMVRDLTHARGRERDRLYLLQQRGAHQKALALHRDYAATGTVAPLRAAASRIVPVVERHVAALRRLHG